MKDTIKMIIDSVSGLKDVLLHIIGLGVLVQLVFVGGSRTASVGAIPELSSKQLMHA